MWRQLSRDSGKQSVAAYDKLGVSTRVELVLYFLQERETRSPG